MPFERLSSLLRQKNKDVSTLPERPAGSERVNEALPYGLITLAEGVDPVVDIVAIHGLDGHRDKSWTVDSGNWLRDLLPTDIPHARIISWGYDARTHSLSNLGGKYIHDHGRTLVSDLCLKRALTKNSRRPIIFVAHSLGAIVLKSALIHSEAARKGALEEHRSIRLSTYGILFMGSPHQGAAGVHLGELVLQIASVFIATDKKVAKHIKLGSEWLEQQLQQYAPISQDFVTKFAYETLPTTSLAMGKKIMIVPKASAVVPGTTDGEPVPISADHVNMVKFASREDVSYGKVAGHLQVMAERACGVIHAQWDEQDRIENVLIGATDNFSMPFSLYGVPGVEEFVGREKELGQMEEALNGDGSVRKVVILQGLGGIGKTQLAVRYLKKHRDVYSAVFWLNGKTEDTLKQSFAAMAKRLYKQYGDSAVLKAAVEAEDIDDAEVGVRDWLSIQGNHRWITVFDNVDNPKTPNSTDPQAYDIKRYFPEAHHGSIIVTTRSSSLKTGRVISIRKLQDVEESLAILSSISGRPNLDQDPHARELTVKLDGLPLALATAGAYLGQVSTSLKEYLRYYTESWLRLQKTSPKLLSYEDRTLYSTWNMSLEHIKSENESAAQLLRLWAYLDNQDVWYELLAAGGDDGPEWFSDVVQYELSFKHVVRLLCDHGLVEFSDRPGGLSRGYGMHSCVHDWTKSVLGGQGDTELERIVLSCLGASVPGEEDPERWAIQRRLLPHASKWVDVVGNDLVVSSDNNEEYLNDLGSLGWLFDDQDKMKEAEVMYHRALDGKEKSLGSEHTSTLYTVNNLGILYRKQGKLNEAEIMYLRALDGREKSLGPEHPSTLDTVNNLGNLYADQGKLKEAEAMYQRALNGKEKSLGPDHTSTLDTVNNLGIMYWEQGKLKEAETMYQRALDGKEKSLGLEHTSTLDTVNNLGVLYWQQCKLEEAEAMYQRALDGNENSLGPEHHSTLDNVNNLGILYRDQGKLKEAEAMYQRALDGKEKSLGLEHTSTLQTVNNLGALYWKQDKLKEAEAMYQRALDGYEKSLGLEHPSTLDTVNNLGVLYQDQSRLKEAEAMLQRALDGREKSLGPKHPSTLDTIFNLGNLYTILGKLEEAEAMYQRALHGSEKALGLAHKSTLDTMYNLSALLKEQCNYEKAEALMRRALEGYKNLLGPLDPRTLNALERLRKLHV